MNFTIPSNKRDYILISPSNKGFLNFKTSNKKRTNRRKIQKGNNKLFHCKTGPFVKVKKIKQYSLLAKKGLINVKQDSQIWKITLREQDSKPFENACIRKLGGN